MFKLVLLTICRWSLESVTEGFCICEVLLDLLQGLGSPELHQRAQLIHWHPEIPLLASSVHPWLLRVELYRAIAQIPHDGELVLEDWQLLTLWAKKWVPGKKCYLFCPIYIPPHLFLRCSLCSSPYWDMNCQVVWGFLFYGVVAGVPLKYPPIKKKSANKVVAIVPIHRDQIKQVLLIIKQ